MNLKTLARDDFSICLNFEFDLAVQSKVVEKTTDR